MTVQTYHGIHIPRIDRPEVLEGLDHFFFRRYYNRRDRGAMLRDGAGPDDRGTLWRVAVSDSVDGWVSVYDEGQNFHRANLIAKALSAYLRRPALWLGLFEDLDFYYQLFSDGDPIDAYDSDPSVFDPEEGFQDEPTGTGWLPADFTGVNKDRDMAVLGNPMAFFAVLPIDDEDEIRAVKLQSLLSRGRAIHGPGVPDFEELSWADDGVAQLARLAGLPPMRATTGFDLLAESGRLPDWLELLGYHPVARAAHASGKRLKEAAG